MKSTSHPKSNGTQGAGNCNAGIRASFSGGRSHEVFNLGLDIAALRPRQRFVVRVLLQRMSGVPLSPPLPPQRRS